MPLLLKAFRLLYCAVLNALRHHGLLHLAAAFGVPLVAIFVGSEPSLTGPLGQGPIAVVGGKRKLPSVEDVTVALESLI